MKKTGNLIMACLMALTVSCVKSTVSENEENQYNAVAGNNGLPVARGKEEEKMDVKTILDTALGKIQAKKPSEAFAILKKGLSVPADRKQSDAGMEDVYSMIDDFLSHVSVEFGNGGRHNVVSRLMSRYDGILLEDNLIFFEPETDDSKRARVSKSTFGNMREEVEKSVDSILKKHSYEINNVNKSNLMYVKETGLYLVAIPSKDIPDFMFLSDNEVLNFAACLKAIIQSAGINVSYNEILGTLINSPVEEKKIRTDKNYTGILSGRKIDVQFISMEKYSLESVVSRELLDGNFLIAIGRGENTGLITYASLKKVATNEYEPIKIRMRIPTLPKTEQRKEISWSDFKANNLAIAVVNIY